MADNNQKEFMELMNALKDYAKANNNSLDKKDIEKQLGEYDLDSNKYALISGYLMANGIKVTGFDEADNVFMQMFENAPKEDDILPVGQNYNNADVDNYEKMRNSDEPYIDAAGNIYGLDDDDEEDDDENLNSDINSDNQDSDSSDASDNDLYDVDKLYEKQIKKLKKKAASDKFIAALDKDTDERYLAMYVKELTEIEPISDTSRAYLLMNIVEDKDKESLKILEESMLAKVVEWVENFRDLGVYTSDLVSEGNLTLIAYMEDQKFLHNSRWVETIKTGGTEELIRVFEAIENAIKDEVYQALIMMANEQLSVDDTQTKVENKVNLINDWAVRLKAELGRKPTAKEVADKMGVSEEMVANAVRLTERNMDNIAEQSDDGK